MRRTPFAGLALALLVALALPPTARSSPLQTMRTDGTTFVRDDPYLPAADALPSTARRPATPRRAAALRAGAAATRRTVRGELARILRAGAIDRETHDEYRAVLFGAEQLRRKVGGARRVAMSAVLRNLTAIAANGGLTASRLPALFETVARNRQWWASGPLLRNGARVSFGQSRLVWQHYAGEGLQIQWLGTWGKANGLWSAGNLNGQLGELVEEALELAAERNGGLGFEYLFRFDGGRPPWVSGLAQGTAIQALSRAAVRLGEPRYFEAARAGLAVFRAAPPVGVRVATPAGAHYAIYSFAPGLRVLNGFTQALNGLFDFAALANDAEGRALFSAGEAQLRSELPRYDTGAWSRYSLQRDSDLGYHTLSRDFLRNLCKRLTDASAPPPAPAPAPATAVGGSAPPGTTATGGSSPAAGSAQVPPGPAPLADPAPYCGAAERFTRYLTEPPALKLVSRRVRGGAPAALRFALSKPASVTLTLRRRGSTAARLAGRFPGGVRTLRWARPPRAAGTYEVTLRATDLAGNDGSADGELTLLRARSTRR